MKDFVKIEKTLLGSQLNQDHYLETNKNFPSVIEIKA